MGLLDMKQFDWTGVPDHVREKYEQERAIREYIDEDYKNLPEHVKTFIKLKGIPDKLKKEEKELEDETEKLIALYRQNR